MLEPSRAVFGCACAPHLIRVATLDTILVSNYRESVVNVPIDPFLAFLEETLNLEVLVRVKLKVIYSFILTLIVVRVSLFDPV